MSSTAFSMNATTDTATSLPQDATLTKL